MRKEDDSRRSVDERSSAKRERLVCAAASGSRNCQQRKKKIPRKFLEAILVQLRNSGNRCAGENLTWARAARRARDSGPSRRPPPTLFLRRQNRAPSLRLPGYRGSRSIAIR